MIAVNLLAQARVARSRRRSRRRLWLGLWAAHSALLGLGVMALARTQTPAADVAAAIEKAQSQRDFKEQEQKTISSEIAALRERMVLSAMVTDHPHWGALLSVLAQSKGPSAMLERIEILSRAPVAERGKDKAPLRESYLVTISGYATTRDDVAGFVKRLEGSGIFDTVTPLETRPSTFGSSGVEIVSFSLSLSLSEGGRERQP